MHSHIDSLTTHVGCDVIMTSQVQQDNHPDVVINRAQFSVGRLKNFRSVSKNKPK